MILWYEDKIEDIYNFVARCLLLKEIRLQYLYNNKLNMLDFNTYMNGR